MTGSIKIIAGGPVVANLPGDGPAPQAVALQPRGNPCRIAKTDRARARIDVTAQRIENSKRLVSELGRRGMTHKEMSEFLGFTESGTRKYRSDLRAAGIVEVTGGDVGTGHEIYTLVNDAKLVAAFIKALPVPRKKLPHRVKSSNLDIAMRDKSRRFHLMADDAYYTVRANKAPAAADPLALPASFFAPPLWITESPPCAHFAKPAPRAPSFPVPSASMFQLGVPA